MNNGVMLLLTILAVIAVVLVAAAIIAVIANMIIGAFSNSKNANNTEADTTEYQTQTLYQAGNQVNDEYDFEAINREKAKAEAEQAKEDDDDEFALNYDDEDEDEDLAEIENNLKQQATDEAVEEDEEDEDIDFSDIDALLDDISDEVVEDEQNNVKPLTQSSELDNYDINTYLTSGETEEAETEEAEVEETATEEVVTPVVDNSVVDEQRKEIEQLKLELERANQALDEARNTPKVSSIEMTEDQCLERLAILEERLKSAKADLKINMKEYRPLKRVVNNLEKYQAKLTRKEAIVANKKSALYGVNNYVDIDKEQAQKLLNESELLEGLRLSVQHCEDVVAANKDRYPILEHTNKILTEEIANIEQDIETTKQTLQAIRDKNGNGDAGEGEEE